MPQPIRDLLRELCRGIELWPAYLSGPVGCGKTRAALLLLDHATGWTQYWTMDELCQVTIDAKMGALYSEGVNPVKMSVRDLWQEVRQRHIIVLDEIGSLMKISPHHQECLKLMLDNREGRPLLLLSNLKLPDLEKLYGDPISSRIAAGTVLWYDGPDMRLTEKGREHD